MVTAILLIVIYFLPTIIAISRKHRNWIAIFLVNLFTGISGLGWIIALVWSVIRK